MKNYNDIIYNIKEILRDAGLAEDNYKEISKLLKNLVISVKTDCKEDLISRMKLWGLD